MVVQSSQNSVGCIFERSTNFNVNNWTYQSFLNNNTSQSWGVRTNSAYAAANFTTRSTSWCVVQFNYNGSDASFTFFSNGTALTKTYSSAENHGTGTSSSVPTFVGARNNAQFFYNGDMGELMTIPSDVGDPMRKRLNHHAAYSFKISCN
jgi:hypothetical protein